MERSSHLGQAKAESTTYRNWLRMDQVVEQGEPVQIRQEAFMASRLGAALGAVGVPEPIQIIESDLVNYQTI